jgi:hypothetical protein
MRNPKGDFHEEESEQTGLDPGKPASAPRQYARRGTGCRHDCYPFRRYQLRSVPDVGKRPALQALVTGTELRVF